MSYLVPRGKTYSKRYAVLFLFLAASALFHGVLLALLFFVYHYDTVVSGITLHRNMPLIKFAPGGTSKPKSLSVINAPAATVKKSVAAVASKPKATVAPVVTPPVEEVKKEKPKGTRAALISGKSEKKPVKKDAEKKRKQKEKKELLEKSKPIKKENSPVVKEVAKAPVATQKVENPVATVQETKPVTEPVATTNVSPNEAQVTNQEAPELGQEVEVALGETIDDPKLLQYYIQLQNVVSDAWKPPVGISDECVCDVLVMLDLQGKAKEVKIVKSSGVLIYDIAARNALQDAKMPKWTYGKTITISFKQ